MGLSLDATQDYNQRMFNMIYAWLSDQGIRQQVAVVTAAPGVVLPMDQYSKQHIILSIDMVAAHHLQVQSYGITFNARFNGRSAGCQVPWEAITGFVLEQSSDGKVMLLHAGFLAPSPDETPVASAPTPTVPVTGDTDPAPSTPDHTTDDGKVVSLFRKNK